MKREPRITGIRRLFSLPTSRRRIDREVGDEIAFHIESRVQELVATGTDAAQARARAEREFGDVDAARRELGDVDRRRHARDNRGHIFESLWQDARYAIRGLRRQPAFVAVVVLTLAVGIGANAVVFGLVDRLLLSPPPHVAEADRVVRIHVGERRIFDGELALNTITNYPIFPILSEQVQAFSDVSAYFRGAYTLGQGPEASDVQIMLVEGNFHSLLGVMPVLGRLILPADDAPPDGVNVAVLSHGLWQRQFAGSESVLGSTILLNGRSFEIVGVTPRGFNGIDLDNTDVWVPLSSMGARFGPEWRTEDRNTWARGIARLSPGATMEQAGAEATLVYRRAIAEWARPWRDSLGTIVPGSLIASRGPDGPSREARVSAWLMGVSAIVLLIACANVLNLLLSRAMQRQREIAVRLAIGVGRFRLARQLLTETLILTLLATLAATALGYWGGRAMTALLLPGIPWAENPMNGRVFGFTALAAMATLLLAGLTPAIRSTRTDLNAALRAGSRAEGGRGYLLRNVLLASQTALCVLLLVGAGLFVQSLRNVRNFDVGVDLDRVMLVHMSLGPMGFSAEERADIYQQATERVRAMPGVESASMLVASAPTRAAMYAGLEIPGRDSLPPLPGSGPFISGVDADYFQTIGARMVRGRAITEADVRTGARVMIVNQTLADYYWPGADPVGECVTVHRDSICSEVIGIVQNIMNFRMFDDPPGSVYVPHGHPGLSTHEPNAVLVRGATDTPSLVVPVQKEIQSLATNMPYVNAQYFDQLVAPELQSWRLGAAMFSIFGIIALLIAMVGLYGVIAYLVTQRTHEIGIRMALGAHRGRVLRMVLGQGMQVVLIGLVLGMAAALFAGRYLGELLYETSPTDPIIFVGVAVVLSLVAAGAVLLPSLRASRVDPVEALRAE